MSRDGCIALAHDAERDAVADLRAIYEPMLAAGERRGPRSASPTADAVRRRSAKD